MCCNLTKALVKAGHEVEVISMFSLHNEFTEELGGIVKIHFLDKHLGFDPSVIFKARKIIKEFAPDVIHTHIGALRYAVFASFGLKVKIVHTVHNIAQKETGKVWQLVNRRHFHSKRVIPVALSEKIKDTVMQVYKLDGDAVPIVLNGIDLDKCIRKTDFSKKDVFTVINVARFSLQKNHIRLLEAFSAFSSRVPEARLVLVGDGELREEIESKIRQLSLDEKAVLAGLQSNVFPFLANADVFTLSSDYEGMPMTLIEAMGTALPIVSTNVGGISDMLENGKEALLTDTTPEALCDAYYAVYSDDALREKLAAGAYIRSKDFSSETMAREYLKIYSGK